jgi:hypothetical protein
LDYSQPHAVNRTPFLQRTSNSLGRFSAFIGRFSGANNAPQVGLEELVVAISSFLMLGSGNPNLYI